MVRSAIASGENEGSFNWTVKGGVGDMEMRERVYRK